VKTIDTFIAIIYIGSKERDSSIIHTYQEARNILQDYCNKISYCVTLKPIEFIYKDGNENGFEVGLINYPRFPSNQEEITKRAIEIAEIFKNKFNQYKISVVCSDKTYMIEQKE
jgi:hypothetical protein